MYMRTCTVVGMEKCIIIQIHSILLAYTTPCVFSLYSWFNGIPVDKQQSGEGVEAVSVHHSIQGQV